MSHSTNLHKLSVLALAICLLTRTADAQISTKPALTLGVAKELASSASKFAQEKKWNVVIAIVDDGGHLLYFERMDGVQTGSVTVAIEKAKSAMAFKRPTKAFGDGVASGRTALVSLPGAMPFDGGVPIKAGDIAIGAIGVSGVTGEQDGMIAQAGADAMISIMGK